MRTLVYHFKLRIAFLSLYILVAIGFIPDLVIQLTVLATEISALALLLLMAYISQRHLSW